MYVVHRVAELLVLSQHRPLTEHEQKEWRESEQFLINREWNLAKLKNFSEMAHMTDDTEWQHEICEKLERMEEAQ
ncbi:DUF7667 family protein [Salibacterium lacus]|uniref:Uncharacterized protein n=1 Tax=Salibacterium lacus TaxID=1898109 RepID=A0ABW5SZX1_9BACI